MQPTRIGIHEAQRAILDQELVWLLGRNHMAFLLIYSSLEAASG